MPTMNTFEDVQVEFLSGGATLQFYDAVDEPDATLDGGRTRNYYVEATSVSIPFKSAEPNLHARPSSLP